MKSRNTLIIAGIILILFNAMSFIAGKVNIPDEGAAHKAGYLVGRNMFFITGVILLLIAYSVHKKVLRKRKKEMLDSFLK